MLFQLQNHMVIIVLLQVKIKEDPFPLSYLNYHSEFYSVRGKGLATLANEQL